MMSDQARAIKAVCDFYGVHVVRLLGGGKTPHLADARAVAMWLLRCWAHCSLPEVAAAVGLVNHTSAIAAVRKVDKRDDLLASAKAIATWLDEEHERRAA
jgi:chromosomal replication initiation ATPase DnaA